VYIDRCFIVNSFPNYQTDLCRKYSRKYFLPMTRIIERRLHGSCCNGELADIENTGYNTLSGSLF
jgi:hypothetical protein